MQDCSLNNVAKINIIKSWKPVTIHALGNSKGNNHYFINSPAAVTSFKGRT